MLRTVFVEAWAPGTGPPTIPCVSVRSDGTLAIRDDTAGPIRSLLDWCWVVLRTGTPPFALSSTGPSHVLTYGSIFTYLERELVGWGGRRAGGGGRPPEPQESARSAPQVLCNQVVAGGALRRSPRWAFDQGV